VSDFRLAHDLSFAVAIEKGDSVTRIRNDSGWRKCESNIRARRHLTAIDGDFDIGHARLCRGYARTNGDGARLLGERGYPYIKAEARRKQPDQEESSRNSHLEYIDKSSICPRIPVLHTPVG
jgi:hypothetical protein